MVHKHGQPVQFYCELTATTVTPLTILDPGTNVARTLRPYERVMIDTIEATQDSSELASFLFVTDPGASNQNVIVLSLTTHQDVHDGGDGWGFSRGSVPNVAIDTAPNTAVYVSGVGRIVQDSQPVNPQPWQASSVGGGSTNAVKTVLTPGSLSNSNSVGGF